VLARNEDGQDNGPQQDFNFELAHVFKSMCLSQFFGIGVFAFT